MQKSEISEVECLPELSDREAVFRDRAHAGRVLSGLLGDYRGNPSTWVLAVAESGAAMAGEISRSLRLPMDVLVVHKITLPWDRGATYGAVAFDGSVSVNESLIRDLALGPLEARYGIEKAKVNVRRRVEELRGTRGYAHLYGMCTILVEDGLSSGHAMEASVSAVKALGVSRIVVAVPTASRPVARRVASRVDRLYCANLRSEFPFVVAHAFERLPDPGDD